MPSERASERPGLTALFFLSGMSALIYQVVWLRSLALVFGVTSYALAIVLAAFMSGLALGSIAGGAIAQRTRRALLAYGLAELAIAAFGFSVVPLLALVQNLYVVFAPDFAGRPAALNLLRLALSFAVLIPATSCMGATLPIAVRACEAGARRAISRLYAANTAGAVVGVLMTGFFLLGVFGLRAASGLAVFTNVMCGIVAMCMAARESRPVDVHAADVDRRAAPLAGVRRIALLTVAVFGFTALAFEVMWTRLFSLLAFELVYGYAAMLAVLLAGIAFGSALYGHFARQSSTNDAVRHLAWLVAGIGVVAASSPVWLRLLTQTPVGPGIVAWPVIGGVALRCSGCLTLLPGLMLLVFVTSVMSGAAFPAAARVCAMSSPKWASRLGATYAANVVGGVLGSIVAGFWMLPVFGAHVSLMALAALNVGAGALLAWVAGLRRASRAMIAAGALAIAPGLVGAARLNLFQTVLSARLGQTTAILWSDEGVESSVAVARQESGERALLINGAIHSTTKALRYHRMMGHLAALAHPAPGLALVIGLGGGGTAGTIALYPGVNLHVVELSSSVFAAADVLSTDNYDLFRRRNVMRTVDDGRNFLLLNNRKYDLIEADLIEPRHAGASVLYSREFFEGARKALAPGGLMIQWLGAPGTDAYVWTARTFNAVFPHVTFWMDGSVGIGSNDPQLPFDRARVERLCSEPAVMRALADAGLDDVEKIAGLRFSGDLAVPDGPLLTDDRPVLEYFLTLPLITRLTARNP